MGKVSSWIKNKIKDNLTHSTDRKQARNPKLTGCIARLYQTARAIDFEIKSLAGQVDVCRSQGN